MVSSIVKLPGKVLGAVGDIAGSTLNRAIDVLPVELHIPGYQYCGPGTKLQERLKRGDPGINPLDAACKQHDIAYYTYKDTKNRAEADRVLAERAWERVKSSDASAAEKAAAWAVTNIMKVKSKVGGRIRKRRAPKKKTGRGMYLRPYSQPKTGCGHRRKNSGRRRAPRRRRY